MSGAGPGSGRKDRSNLSRAGHEQALTARKNQSTSWLLPARRTSQKAEK